MSGDIVYSGTIQIDAQKASSNVQELQAKLDKLDKGATIGADGVKRLNQGFEKGAQAVGGLQQASNAYSQFMAGNFVGAMSSGANAVKALWVALSANPLSAIALAVAGFALYVFKYFDGIKKRAEEDKKSLEDSRKSFEDYAKERDAWENRDSTPIAVATKTANGTSSVEVADKALKKAKEMRQLAKETAQIQQENLEKLKASGGDRLDPEGVKAQQAKVDEAKQAEEDARKIVDIWTDKLTEIQDAKTKLNEQNLADEKKRIDELAEYEKQANAEVAKMKKDFERVQMEDAIADPVAKLVFRKQGLEEERDSLIGNASVEADKRRQEIAEAIYKLDKDITAEKAKQADLARKASETEVEATKTVKEAIAIPSPENPVEPAGAKGQKVRHMGTRNATEWFRETMQARRDAMGVNRLTYDMQGREIKSKAVQDVASKKNPLEDYAKSTADDMKEVRKTLCGT